MQSTSIDPIYRVLTVGDKPRPIIVGWRVVSWDIFRPDQTRTLSDHHSLAEAKANLDARRRV